LSTQPFFRQKDSYLVAEKAIFQTMTQEYKKIYKKKKEEDYLASAANELGNRPPQATDIEEAVLGAMLVDNDCVSDGLEVLKEKSFYDPKLRIIYAAIVALYNEKSAIDLLTVTEKLKQMGALEEVGGAVRIADLTQKVGSAAHIEFYLKILQQKTIQRDLINAAYGILKDSFDESTNVDHLIESSQTRVFDAVTGNVRSQYKQIGEVVNLSLDRVQSVQNSNGITGIPSGFPSLDNITMGWQQSNLVIIGARPSMGKTAFALNMARNAAVNFDVPTAFFSLEMADIELSDRLIAAESGISSDKLRGREKMEDEDWTHLEAALGRLVKAPLYIDETPGITITEFSSKVKRMKREKGIRLVFVDYLQLMHASVQQQGGYREQEVSAISQSLKAIAKELHITVIALAQLNRNLMNRMGSNGRPTLSDLRDSGSIEQDADMVIFVHRPGMIGFDEDKSRTEIIIAKHRNGRTDTLGMRYHGEIFQFTDERDSLQSFAVESRINSRERERLEYNPFEHGSNDFEPRL
jgi:replicative DNA helicase